MRVEVLVFYRTSTVERKFGVLGTVVTICHTYVAKASCRYSGTILQYLLKQSQQNNEQ
jgi:hypothetical protein